MSSTFAKPAEIRVYCTFGLRSIILELAGPFQRESGHTISFQFDATPGVKARIVSGEVADVVLIARAIADDLQAAGHLPVQGIHDVARSGIGVAIKAGAAKPDISTPEAFKTALLAAKSVVYTDPASGGASGVHFANVVEKLGVSAQMQPKSLLNIGSYNSDLVVSGESELAIQQIAEILPVKGVELLGPLPGDLQLMTVFVAAIGRTSEVPDAARDLIGYLKSPAADPVIRSNGMEPV